MRRLILTSAVMLASQVGSQIARADSSLTLPWTEFKTLYTEKIQQQYEDKNKATTVKPIVSIDEAHYKVSINKDDALVDVYIQGNLLQGKPDPVPLFNNAVAIREVAEVEGGAIISDETGYRFYLESADETKTKNDLKDLSSINVFKHKPFHTRLSLVIPLEEDQQSQYLSFKIPSAVKNILDVELPLGMELIEHPGIEESLQRFYFAPNDQLRLRFFNTQNVAQTTLKIDTFTQVELQGDKYIFSMVCVPLQAMVQEAQLEYVQPLRYLDSTLKPSWIKQSGSDHKSLKIIPEKQERSKEPFMIRFEADARKSLQDLQLPGFSDNAGREGDFHIIESVEAQIAVESKQLRRDLPLARLPGGITTYLETNLNTQKENYGDFHTLERGHSFSLNLQRFDTVDAPEVVLDDLYFYTSFAENGSEISVLRMTLPKYAGDRLKLTPIPDAEIWSLTVNEKKREVFTHTDTGGKSVWVIPLDNDNGNESIVELTYLQKHPKLSLEGKLPITIPATGMAAQNVFVNIGLIDRVELVAMEGELMPAIGIQPPVVQSFTGNSYVFQYPFYQGEALQAVLFYKEPLTNNLQAEITQENWMDNTHDG